MKIFQPISETSNPYDENLRILLAELIRLRDAVVSDANMRVEPFLDFFDDRKLTASAQNLVYYLAIRKHDLRPLQERLAQVGLSSLGRGEAHIMRNIDLTIALLSRAIDSKPPGESACIVDYAETDGSKLLQQHTDEVFGGALDHRSVRIMVTLPSDSAKNYKLIKSLMKNGMNCARINCAHDDADAWGNMVDHIHKAERELGCNCKILIDLAGHKVRTGPLQLGPPVAHIKVKKNVYGRVLKPTEILLIDNESAKFQETTQAALNRLSVRIPSKVFVELQKGDNLCFNDSRGKKRTIKVHYQTHNDQWIGLCHKNTYLEANTWVDWERQDVYCSYKKLDKFAIGEFEGQPVDIHLSQGDVLLLTWDAIPGKNAEYNENAGLVAPAQISCTHPSIIESLQPGNPVWFDDGKIGTIVDSISEEGALLKVVQLPASGARLKADKGINFPETRITLPPLSDKDLKDLDFVCKNADMVGFSFVESLEDIQYLSRALKKRGAENLPIIAKIETNRAVKNLPNILLGTIGRHKLGIMIARGDLAVELGSVRLAEVQEEILWLSEAAHVPVIWATQVLETLAKKGLRSRPEITDAAMGVRAECVMLNKGPYIMQAILTLDNILERMQSHQVKKASRLRALHW